MTILITALLSFVGIGFGAFLQFMFSRTTEVWKQTQAAKSQAYIDYLRAVAQAAHAVKPDEQAKATLLLADAKTRMVVYGDPTVLEALAALEAIGAVLDNPQAHGAFLKLASAMRAQAGGVDEAALSLILLGPSRSRLKEGQPTPDESG